MTKTKTTILTLSLVLCLALLISPFTTEADAPVMPTPIPTLTLISNTVSLTANPVSGNPPLSISLTATINQGFTNTANYTFYCNRGDIGTSTTTPYNHRQNNYGESSYIAVNLCSYSIAGSYTAKVIIETGEQVAEARTIVIVEGGAVPAPIPTPTSTTSYTPPAHTDPSLPYSNGSFVKTADSNKIYLIVNNQKRWMANSGVFVSYGFAPNSEIIVSQAELDKYPLAQDITLSSLPEGTLIRAKNDYKVYIIQPPYKRHIFNPAVFEMYQHFNWNSIQEVDPDIADSYITSDLYRADSDYRVYYLEEIDEVQGKAIKHHFNLSAQQFTNKGYSWNQVFVVNTMERNYYETGWDIVK